ncbi:RimK family alpha-L-glutamate ligase [Alicyclobacillus sp. SO9]|uniref:ATP-grasp domain-containing protein n=1 Tax=Alicyclobacillus sp. SO9 TaxID=2665646 RepID=UPI0018E87B4F|nr:RimK family alpha-L-glutamate ligase [Alicyclobacillus sp. SO9]QQE78247.1 RimK family alpha-L-glutamate ligase [Alicyclobacillus sp. SO9]
MTSLSGWIIYNGNLGDKFLTHAEIFHESAKKHGIHTKIVPNNSLFSMVSGGTTQLLGMEDERLPDFVLFWDKDLYLARHLEKLGVRLFNPAQVIETCDNKGLTYQWLSDCGIAMPKTVLSPRIFDWTGVKEQAYYSYVAEELGFPMVMKESYGSFGSQVYLIQNEEEMLGKVKELGSIPFVFQEFVRSSKGTDLRLQVVGDEVVGAMRRVSDTDFRANMGKGAHAFPHSPTTEQKELAVRCAKELGADFAGVDLLFGPEGEPILCEVNSNAHIINLRTYTGVNAADYMLLHIKRTMAGVRV